MPQAARSSKPRADKAPKAKDAPEPETLLADMQRAQLEFTGMVEETYRQATLRSSEAYQKYLQEVSGAQNELQQRALDAFEALQASLTAALDAGDIAKQAADAYESYVTAVGALFDTSQAVAKAHEADASYLKVIAETQGQPDAEARVAEAYATYLADARAAWDKSAETQQVNTTLEAWLDLLKLAQSNYQKQAYDAYRAYVEALREAPAATQILERSEKAHDAYLKTLNESWEAARESFKDAAASTVLKTLQQAWSKA